MSRATTAISFPPPEPDYPVRPAGALTRNDWVWLLILSLLALVPRAIVALRLGPVCDDGYFYLAVADAYERGDLSAALHYLNINVYPVLLAALHRLGLDPMAAAKCWGVAAGPLVGLPLFGWLRRMVDRRVAIAACAIYALHTEFIELSPEPIRDPTFWLLSVLGFYLIWRSATERRLWLFVAAGLAIALAAHTRTEGWLLLLPAIAWPVARWKDAAGRRLAVVFGMAACLAMTPVFLVAFNVTVLARHDHWELGRLEYLRKLVGIKDAEIVTAAVPAPIATVPAVAAAPRAAMPLAATVVPAAKAATPAPKPPGRDLPDRLSSVAPAPRASSALDYFRGLGRTLEPVPLLLMLIGVFACRRVLIRPEHLVLSACCVAVLLAVWFRLATSGEINGRYFLLCFFPAAGAAGIGLLATLNFAERRWPWHLNRPAAGVATIAILVGGAQAGDAVLGTHPSRGAEGRLGLALADRFGEGRSVLVTPRACRVGYFVAGGMPSVMLDVVAVELVIERTRPDLVIIESRDTPRAEFEELHSRLVLDGWTPYPLNGLPEADRFVVFTSGLPQKRPLGLARRDDR